MISDEELMALAIDEARAALDHGDVPIGALVVIEGEVVASRHNERELRNDPTAHAELLAMRDAASLLGRWRLDGAAVVATIEPCLMCAGALVGAHVAQVIFGAYDKKAGGCGSLYNLASDPRLNHELTVTSDVLSDQCASLVQSFFAERRARADSRLDLAVKTTYVIK